VVLQVIPLIARSVQILDATRMAVNLNLVVLV